MLFGGLLLLLLWWCWWGRAIASWTPIRSPLSLLFGTFSISQLTFFIGDITCGIADDDCNKDDDDDDDRRLAPHLASSLLAFTRFPFFSLNLISPICIE